MKITYRESGGFAGLVKGTEIDTDSLDPTEAQGVALLVEQSGIEGDKKTVSSESRDLLQYDISIEGDTGRERLVLDSANVTEQVKPLLKYLKQRAQPRPLD